MLSKTKVNYPAPVKIIHCVKTGLEQSPAKGYQIEAEHFSELVMSPESAQLRNLFFATTEMKKEMQSLSCFQQVNINLSYENLQNL